jgi:hypothetical protein
MGTDLRDAYIQPSKVLLRTETDGSVAIGDCHMCQGNYKPQPNEALLTATLAK